MTIIQEKSKMSNSMNFCIYIFYMIIWKITDASLSQEARVVAFLHPVHPGKGHVPTQIWGQLCTMALVPVE